MTLAVIIEEGERLEADVQSAIDMRMPTCADVAIGLMHDFYAEHGHRLLPVAKAGRTLAAAVAGTGSCTEELAAFDTAVRGEGKEKEG